MRIPPSDSIQDIINALKKGKHIVLSFGKHESDLDYLLVSNLLTRRIREEWEKLTNAFRSQSASEPRPLVIAVEEAHKLLNREMAAQTTFSTIAREMRKYYVTLLVIDQRPSQIYDEVMSQLGTRVCGWLGDDDDIGAALSGLARGKRCAACWRACSPRKKYCCWAGVFPCPSWCAPAAMMSSSGKRSRARKNDDFDQEKTIRTMWPG